MLYNLLILLFFEAAHCDNASLTLAEYSISTQPIAVNATTSSEVINKTGALSEIDCLLNCQSQNCSGVAFIEAATVCQMLIINDESQSLSPQSHHVDRLLGGEVGAQAWKINDFEKRIALSVMNYLFINTSRGRLGDIQEALISLPGCYRIEAAGARGGGHPNTGKKGGPGALAAGSYILAAGIRLSIVVGQAGSAANEARAGGGGGGGSFVYRTIDDGNDELLLAAGGGGGAADSNRGKPGSATTSGSDSYGSTKGGKGGTNGAAGFSSSGGLLNSMLASGGCGAGWLGKTKSKKETKNDGEGGGSRAQGWVGGRPGDYSKTYLPPFES